MCIPAIETKPEDKLEVGQVREWKYGGQLYSVVELMPEQRVKVAWATTERGRPVAFFASFGRQFILNNSKLIPDTRSTY